MPKGDVLKFIFLVLFFSWNVGAQELGAEPTNEAVSHSNFDIGAIEFFESKSLTFEVPSLPIRDDGSLDSESLTIFQQLTLNQQAEFRKQRDDIFRKFVGKLASLERIVPSLHKTNLGILRVLNLNLWRRAGRMVAPSNKGFILMLGVLGGAILGSAGEYRFHGYAISVFPKGPNGKSHFRIQTHTETSDRTNKFNFFLGLKFGLRYGVLNENVDVNPGGVDKGDFALFPGFLNVFSSAKQSSNVLALTLNIVDVVLAGGVAWAMTNHMHLMASTLGVMLASYTISSGFMGVYGDYAREFVMQKAFDVDWFNPVSSKAYFQNLRQRACSFLFRKF